jgi:hypothetical protein
MSERFEDLPVEIQQRFLSFTREREDGTVEVPDRRALIDFIIGNADAYPALLDFVKIDGDRVIEHAKETGEVPPGVKIIKTRTVEGSNVTDVRIFHGPTMIPEDDRE